MTRLGWVAGSGNPELERPGGGGGSDPGRVDRCVDRFRRWEELEVGGAAQGRVDTERVGLNREMTQLWEQTRGSF